MESLHKQHGILSLLNPPPPPPPLRRTLSAGIFTPKIDRQFNKPTPTPEAAPYVHPLLKKSSTSLTQHSLFICTEGLGAESAHFDPIIPSPEAHTFHCKPLNCRPLKSPPRSFPPPISSLTSPDGASLSIHSRREDGRLILHAVSAPSRNNFRADRKDGRLILSILTTPPDSKEPKSEAPRLPTSVLNFHRLATMMKNPTGFINRNPAWTKEKEAPLSHSLPPPASLNSYEYYWRSKPTGIQTPIGQHHKQPITSVTRKLISSNNQMANEKQQILVLRGNRGDYLVPLSNGCKLPRRSLLLREPCCIATT